MAGLATITLSISSCRAEEAADQSSYPLKSENAIPLGDISEYLSFSLFWPCAKTAAAPRTPSTATAVAMKVKPAIRAMAVRVSIFRACCSCAPDLARNSDMYVSLRRRLCELNNVHLER